MNNLVRVNATATAKAKETPLDGQPHLVVPVIAIVEGVLNGIYYSGEELNTFAESWNGVPVPVNHPKINNQFVSANRPEFEETVNIGKFYNVNYEGGKLKGEIWINIDKANRLGFGSIVEKFRAGEMMELSTGLFSETVQKTGIWNAQTYNFEAKGIRPDHLALLTDELGACSIADGCGAMRTNALTVNCQGGKTCKPCDREARINALRTLQDAGILANELSHGDVRDQLRAALSASISKLEYGYVVEVFQDRFIYELEAKQGGTSYLERGYKIEGDKVTLEGEVREVIKKTIYEPVKPKTMENQSQQAGGASAPVINKPEVNAAAPQLSAEDIALFQQLKANEKRRVENLRAEVIAGYPNLKQEIVANMDGATLEALASGIAKPADYSARAGAAPVTNEQQKESPHRPILLGNALSDKK